MATLGKRSPAHTRIYLAAAAILAAGVVLSLVVSSSNSPGQIQRSAVAITSPVVELGASVHGATETLWLSLFSTSEQQDRITELEEELARLRVEAATERSQLALDALAMDVSTNIPTGTFDLVAAPVILQPKPGGQQVLWIRGGFNEDLRAGMVVLGPRGIVGQIDEVYDTRSLVLLATDHEATWGAELEGGGEIGLLRGRGNAGSAEFHFHHTAATAEVGDSVVSTGMAGSLAPGGIPFGTIKEISRNKNGELIAQIEFPQPPEELRTVFILPVVRIAQKADK